MRADQIADVRGPAAWARGIVVGSWLLRPTEIRLLPGPVWVIGAPCPAGAEPLALADSPWPVREPAWKSPLPPGHRVRFQGAPGRIQDVVWTPVGFAFSVAVLRDGGLVRVDGLPEEDLESVGPRGAAGLSVLTTR